MTLPPDDSNEERGTVTNRLLKLLHTKGQPQQMHEEQAEHAEEEVHIDERWLIAYADKMTILCGFFIMLFAISTLDPVKLQKVQKSAEKSFGKPTEAKPKEAVIIEPSEFEKIKTEHAVQVQKIEALEKKNIELLQLIPKTVQPETTQILQKQIQKIQEEKSQLQVQVKELQVKIQATEQVKIKNEILQKQIQQVETKNRTLEKKIDLQRTPAAVSNITKENEDLRTVVQKLEEENKILKANAVGTGFAAFVMSWGSRDQDIDLYVEDPEKKVFNFKQRQYKTHPGLLVLDTRQGPGVEVWQSDKILPGIYTFTYVFYNSYGNEKPCPITGTLFTSKGRVDMPKITLDPSQTKQAKFKLQIDENGKAEFVR